MAQQVCMGAMMTCSFGTAPSSLVVLPTNCTFAGGPAAANIMDYVPMVNIMTFAMCTSPSNPSVAAATAAALGVLTPMPCIPATASPWTPGSPTVMIGKQPALSDSCQLMCSYAGVIKFSFAGQATVQVA
jgi:hypothetical protein